MNALMKHEEVPCDCGALGIILTAVFFGSIGFLVGSSLSPWYLWGALGVVLPYVFVKSPKSCAWVVVLLMGVWVFTAYTFAYTGVDAVFYHVPTQLLLKKGWNPVAVSTCERFFASVENIAWFRPYHVLFLPHFNALAGAIVAMGTGLWLGDPFLNYLLFVVLFNVARRFSGQIWGCSPCASFAFAVAVTFSPKASSFLAGQVDYIVYATFFIACFAGFLAYREGLKRDWFLLFAAMAIGALSKNNGIFSGGFAFLGCLWPMRKNKMFWIGFVLTVIYCLIVGASPYLTNWINYGSPFYPNHTFRSGVEVIDLTEDFVGNVDAESMGYFARVAYAWVSPILTVKVLSWLRGCAFEPEFYVSAGVAGSGSGMRLMLLLGVVALAFSKKGFVTALCIGVFLLSNFAPVKYIGYARYFPWIWGVPILALYQFAYNHYDLSRRWMLLFGFAAVAAVASLGVFMFLRTLSVYVKDIVWESARQRRLEEMSRKSKTWFATPPAYQLEALKHVNGFYCEYGLAMRDRLRLAGLAIVDREDSEPRILGHEYFDLYPRYEHDSGGSEILTAKFPLCSSAKDLLRMHWCEAFSDFPRPLMD